MTMFDGAERSLAGLRQALKGLVESNHHEQWATAADRSQDDRRADLTEALEALEAADKHAAEIGDALATAKRIAGGQRARR